MRSQAAAKSAVITLALVGTALAFLIGAQAGSLLNRRVMGLSIARMPVPVIAEPTAPPVAPAPQAR